MFRHIYTIFEKRSIFILLTALYKNIFVKNELSAVKVQALRFKMNPARYVFLHEVIIVYSNLRCLKYLSKR